MSNSVYPTLPGLDWNVVRSIIAPPVAIRTTPSQREFRARDATVPRYQYSLSYEFLRSGSQAEWQTLSGFFNQMGGDFDSFLFLDPDDNSAVAAQFGVGNGTTSAWQLVRPLGGFSEPVGDVSGLPIVFENGVAAVNRLSPTSSFETDANADGVADGWVAYSSGTTGTITRSLLSSPLGGLLQRVVAATLGAGASRAGVARSVTLTGLGGQPFVFSAHLRNAQGGTCRARLYVEFLNVASGTLGTLDSGVVSPGTSGVTRFSFSGTLPADTASASLYIWEEDNASPGTQRALDIDHVQFETSASLSAYTPNYASVGANTGIATFTIAPAGSVVLTWTGNFYRRCRFLRGQLEFRKFMQDYWEAKKVELLSIKVGSQ